MNEGCPDSACELDIKSFAEDCRSLDESEKSRNTSTSREPRRALVRSQGACCAIFLCEPQAELLQRWRMSSVILPGISV